MCKALRLTDARSLLKGFGEAALFELSIFLFLKEPALGLAVAAGGKGTACEEGDKGGAVDA
jgi:hypothetical protein